MLFFSNMWLNIDLSFKYFILIFFKNIFSYNEELFLFIVYVLLFLIIIINTVFSAKKSLINLYLDLLEFYEKLVYLKSYLLQLLKMNYILLKKCEYIKKYIKNIFLKLYQSEKINLKIIQNNINIINLLNYNSIITAASKLKIILK